MSSGAHTHHITARLWLIKFNFHLVVFKSWVYHIDINLHKGHNFYITCSPKIINLCGQDKMITFLYFRGFVDLDVDLMGFQDCTGYFSLCCHLKVQNAKNSALSGEYGRDCILVEFPQCFAIGWCPNDVLFLLLQEAGRRVPF